MNEISETKFEELCKTSQRLDTICNYIMERVQDNYNYISLDILACMAGISEEYRKAKEAEHGTDDK